MALKIVAIFREFNFFQNKAKNAGRFRKNAGRKAKCGISRTIAGWLTPKLFESGFGEPTLVLRPSSL